MLSQRTLLPLVAVSGGLAASPANALELGDMKVQSGLGQPLRASIAYVLAPHEQLNSSCVTVGAGKSQSGLPGVGRTTVSVADGIIQLVGRSPVREPMVAANVLVNCAYTMKLNREYTLFIDPVDRVAAEQAAMESTAATTSAPVSAAPVRAEEAVPVLERPQAAVAEPVAAAPRRAPSVAAVQREAIGQSTRYQVQPGDSLSQIAARIQNRPVGLWAAVDVIFEANPHAFIDNDKNKVMAGSWLEIPSLDGSEPVLASSGPAQDSTPQSQPDADAGAVDDSAVVDANIVQDEPLAVNDGVEEIEVNAAEVSEIAVAAAEDLAAYPEFGEADELFANESATDVELDADNPFVDFNVTTDDSVVIPDTELAGPTTSSTTANVPTAIVTENSQQPRSSWLLWLAGAGVAIIIGLLLFGRFFRRSGDLEMAPRSYPSSRRYAEDESSGIEVSEVPAGTLDNEDPTEENVALDASLSVGSGLVSTATDETAKQTGIGIGGQFEDSSPTVDTLAQPIPEDAEDDTILESEVLPEGEDYDLSVIIDATKMPQPEDISQRDLKAVEVSLDDTQETDNYTINREVDFDILAQDYEDEFTATQAVNTEITRAATELANDLGADNTDAWLTTEETVLVPDSEKTVLMTEDEQETAMMESQEDTLDDEMAVTAFDVAEQLQLTDEEASDLDDLDKTMSETGKMELLAEDYTLEMTAAQNDEDTREMEVGGDTVETKKAQ